MSAKAAKPVSPTAGPWLIDENANVYAGSDEQTTMIAYIYHQGSSERDGRANARLIAQTPRMLSILKVVVDETTGELQQQIRSIIQDADPTHFTK